MALLEVEGLHLTLNGTAILHDIGFTVAAGSHLGIVGPNGAGKSSLLKCIMGIFESDGGTIMLDGKSARQMSQRERARLVSLVPQTLDSLPAYTVETFVGFGRYPHRRDLAPAGRDDQGVIETALADTDLLPLREHQLPTLSGGELQRTLIAAALAQEAPLLLLDEPTSALDPHHLVEVHQLLRRLRAERQITLITVTHDINAALQNCNNILALQEGTCAFLAPPEEVLRDGRLTELYGPRFHQLAHPALARPWLLPEGF